jgi:nucleotide-binding universal stress UspA family protein
VTYSILVPFELPGAEPISPVLVEALASMDVVALGHYALPEQTPPDAGRGQFQTEAAAELEDLAAPFQEAGASVTTRLVFGKARAKTIDRVTVEEGCDAELDPAPTGHVERVLVPIADTQNLDRLSDFVAALCADTTTDITLFHVVEQESDESVAAAEEMLAEAREAVIAHGYDPGLVDVQSRTAEGHDDAILERAEAYDAVVMGEAHPGGVRERIFGTLADRIASQTGDPVVVVRRARGGA